MAKDYVTFILDDELTLEEFTSAIVEFNSILENLTKAVSKDIKIKWILNGLNFGSAQTVAKGCYENEAQENIVHQTVEKYEQFSEDIFNGNIMNYPTELRKSASKIIDLSDRIPIRFETEDKDVYLYKPQKKITKIALNNIEDLIPDKTYGSVRGRVESISSRKELRFVLYDAVYDKAVSCYLKPEQKEQMRTIWGSLAYVEGTVKRDIHTGRPLTIRDITIIEKIEEIERDEWREAIGCCAVSIGSITPEEAIDIIRNE